MKLEILLQIFETYSSTKFHENPFTGTQIVPCGRTDNRHDEANSHFSKFRERA